MPRYLVFLTAILLLLALGCGKSSNEPSTPGTGTQIGPTGTVSGPPPSEQGLAGCLKAASYKVEVRTGNIIRATTSSGASVAVVQIFPNVAKAKKFAKKIPVQYLANGKYVAIFGAGSVDADSGKVGNCLKR